MHTEPCVILGTDILCHILDVLKHLIYNMYQNYGFHCMYTMEQILSFYGESPQLSYLCIPVPLRFAECVLAIYCTLLRWLWEETAVQGQ